MELNLLYVHGESIGYGRLGVFLAEALREMKVTVYDHLPGPDEDVGRLDTHLNQGRQAGISNVVCWVSVPTHARGWWKNQIPVVFTMWEATKLPESFRRTLHEFDSVIVPSQQNVELFSQYHDNVKYVPLGVNPAQWFFIPREEPRLDFNFLIGGSGPRKGTDLVHRAFRKLWPNERSWGNGPVPKLIMKNPRGEQFYGPRIEMVTGRISAAAEVDLYARAHCYVQPSRGEGFGLQPLQALAQGCPTILTDAHGHTSFSHLGEGIGSRLSKSQYFIYGDAGEWWEPDFNELCERMEYVYNNYTEACGKAADAAAVIRESFTWRDTAEAFIAALGPERLTTHDPSYLEWYIPKQKRYLVITNTDWTADIGGSSYQFRRGEEYWELADVKRILFEAELLDPRCVNPQNGGEWNTWADVGLTPEQLERVNNYTAAHSHCHACGQKLGGKTRADEIYEELTT